VPDVIGAARVVDGAPLAAVDAGCMIAAVPDIMDDGEVPWAAELDPGDHDPTPKLDGVGVRGSCCTCMHKTGSRN
jgi:hypothetical protein